jgi:hypothetical protein
MAAENKGVSGKWVVAVLLAVGLILAILRFLLVPRTNPREADPGSPYYSPPTPEEVSSHKPQP